MNFPTFWIYRNSLWQRTIGKQVICRTSIEMVSRSIYSLT